MKKQVHGGDRYHNQVRMDFSVNVNPLGIPEKVRGCFEKLTPVMEYYPDPEGRKLKEQLAKKLGIPKEFLLLGNGASELFMIIIHSLNPQKTVVPVPSFVGYEHMIQASGGETVFWKMGETMTLDETLLELLDSSVDLLVLTNPNNPTGKYIEPILLKKILDQSRKKGITVLLDECFIELSDECERHTIIHEIENYPNVLLVRAFTKTYAIPGIRLGYLVCSNSDMVELFRKHTPEWNLSTIAQEVGVIALEETDYLKRAVELIRKERTYLEEALETMGCLVVSSNTNFILFQSKERKISWYEELLKRGILIRDCENYKGLEDSFYRIAVKTHKENEKLIEEMKNIIEKRG